MRWTEFLVVKHNANLPNILVRLQLLWLHSAYQLKVQLVFLHLLPFGRNSSAKLCPPLIRPPLLVLGYGAPRESKMVSIEISTPHSYSTSIHTISCTVLPQCTTRQTTGTGRLYVCLFITHEQQHRRLNKGSPVRCKASEDDRLLLIEPADNESCAHLLSIVAFPSLPRWWTASNWLSSSGKRLVGRSLDLNPVASACVKRVNASNYDSSSTTRFPKGQFRFPDFH